MKWFVSEFIPAFARSQAMTREALRVEIAKAIYFAAFDPESRPGIPSPGWSWEKTSDTMRLFSLRQADFALDAIESNGCRIVYEEGGKAVGL